MSVRIIIDSACDLPKEDAARLGIDVLPLKTIFGEEEFLDGFTITHQEFYQRLVDSDVLPSTSQLPPVEFEAIYADVKTKGDTAVVITLSAKLSGTYQSAHIALDGYEDIIHIVDSGQVSLSQQLLALHACKLRDEGCSAEEIAAALEIKKQDVRIIAVLDTLEYLQRGGRIPKGVAVAGNLLSIKPLVTVNEGLVVMLGMARGAKNARAQLTKAVEEAGGVNFSLPCAYIYSGLEDDLLQKYIEETRWDGQYSDIPVYTIGSAIGTHVGPGAYGVAFFTK